MPMRHAACIDSPKLNTYLALHYLGPILDLGKVLLAADRSLSTSGSSGGLVSSPGGASLVASGPSASLISALSGVRSL